MKNREYQKIVAAALTVALVLGGSQMPAIPVWAQENVQSLLNGDMSAQEYCDMMAETYEATK